jgi:hypothetical protein
MEIKMKAFFINIFIISLLSISSFQLKALEIKTKDNNENITVNEICINNLAFVIAFSGQGYHKERNITLVQVFTQGKQDNRPPQPKTCISKINKK